MTRKLFLSYNSADKKIARELQAKLEARKWTVWRDEVTIAAGARWPSAIDTGLRDSAAVVVLLSASSASSAWVTYEYAFATGAGRPIVAVVCGDVAVPEPIRQFQVVRLGTAGAARLIDKGLREQIRAAALTAEDSEALPMLVAKFREDEDGELYWRPTKEVREIPMELWLENAPRKTTSVDFSVLAEVRGANWTKRRKKGARAFLSRGVNLYGDVEIVARGELRKGGDWKTESRLYDALVRYYTGRELDGTTRRALEQIRRN